MGLLKGLAKIALSPVRGIAEVALDLNGNNGEDSQGLSILTAGTSSALKGTAKGLIDGVTEIFDI